MHFSVSSSVVDSGCSASTASYITTPGPVLHDISHVHCEGQAYDGDNMMEIDYNRQLTSSMNHNYARELPAHYLKHWGLLVDWSLR